MKIEMGIEEIIRIAVAAPGIDPVKAELAPTFGMTTHILILYQASNVFDSIDREPDTGKAPLDFEAGLSRKKKKKKEEVDVLLTKQCETYIAENLVESGFDVNSFNANTLGEALEHFKLEDFADGSPGQADVTEERRIREDDERVSKREEFLLKSEAYHRVQSTETGRRAGEARAAKK